MEEQYWISEEEYNKMSKWAKELDDKQQSLLMWGKESPYYHERTPEEKYNDSVKYAYVLFEGNSYDTMVGRSNIDGKVFKMEDNGHEWLKPLVEDTRKNTFVRWCRLMDL